MSTQRPEDHGFYSVEPPHACQCGCGEWMPYFAYLTWERLSQEFLIAMLCSDLDIAWRSLGLRGLT